MNDAHGLASRNLIDRFEQDGAVLVRNILAEDEIDRLRAATDRFLESEARTKTKGDYFRRLLMWQEDPDFRYLCLESRCGAVAAALLGSDVVNLIYDQLFVKPPGTTARSDWHNDLPYWPLRGNQVLTLWVAFDPIGENNGPLEFIRGSHRWNRWYRPFNSAPDGSYSHEFTEDGEYEELPDFEAERDRHDIVTFPMQAGDAIAFHGLTVHSAKGNLTRSMPRRGCAVRYAGADVRYHGGKVWNVDLIDPSLKTGDPLNSPKFPVAFSAG